MRARHHHRFARRPGARAGAVLPVFLAAALGAGTLTGCATRAADVVPTPTNPAEFAAWTCERIDEELDSVQQRAADVAYSVDERAGHNILALGVGLAVFWPAILAMRPDGLEAADLARLKGRFEALTTAGKAKSCPARGTDLPAERAATLPLAVGERLVYEERGADKAAMRQPPQEWALRVVALRRGEVEYRYEPGPPVVREMPREMPREVPREAARDAVWRQDRNGNVIAAPPGSLQWPYLLRGELAPGAVTAGDITVVGDPLTRARVRGQVVAVGPQMVAGRRFDVAVVELFGDATRGEGFTRVEGSIVVDRLSGVLLRLDLRSAQASFSVQRQLLRVEPAGG